MVEEDKLALTVEEAARMLSVSRTTFYELIASKIILTVKIGRRRVVPIEELRKLLTPSKAA
jgi:excisionase family DNA binding protein